MRRAGAICAVAARQIVWKLLVIVLAMAARELAIFWSAETSASFYQMTKGVQMSLVYRQAMLVLTVLLCWQGTDFRGKLGYTLARLPDSEAKLTTLWAAVHVAAYVILWAAQVGVVLVLWQLFLTKNPEIAAPRLALLIEFYGAGHVDGFLHSLLPMDDWLRWARVLLWYLSLGAATAQYGFVQRRDNRKPILALAVFAVGQMLLNLEIGQWALDALAAAACCFVLYGCWSSVWRCRDEED